MMLISAFLLFNVLASNMFGVFAADGSKNKCVWFNDQVVKYAVKLEQLEGEWWGYQGGNVLKPHDCLNAKIYITNNNNGITMIWDYILREMGAIDQDHTKQEWSLQQNGPDSGVFISWKKAGPGKQDMPLYEINVVNFEPDFSIIMSICSEAMNFGKFLVMTRKQNLDASETVKLEEKLRQLSISNANEPYNWKRRELTPYTIKSNANCKPAIFPSTLP